MKMRELTINGVSLFAIQAKEDISEKVKRIPGASYHRKVDTWYFPSYHPFGLEVYNDLKMIFGDYLETDISVDKRVLTLKKVDAIINRKKVPNFNFKTDPMEHQLEGLLQIILSLRWALFWECGAGKTKVAIDAVRFLKKNTLYLCPTRLVENTADEFKTHSFDGEFDVHPIVGKWTAKKKMRAIDKALASCKNERPQVFIIGYETVSRNATSDKEELNYYQKVANLPYTMVFMDESHKLRSIKSNISNVVAKLVAKSPRRILMTGTPSLGNPLHLYVQMRAVMPWRYPNYFAYKNKFVVTSQYDKNIVVGFKNLHILRKEVDKFSSRKTKEDCLDLPERQVVYKEIDMSIEQLKLYKEVDQGIHASVAYNPITILKMTKLHQLCGGTLVESPIDDKVCDDCPQMPYCIDKQITPFSKQCINKNIERPITIVHVKNNPKLDYLLELLNTLCNGEGKKVILWYKYLEEKKILLEALKGFNVIQYKGQEDVREFQETKVPSIFFAQIQQSSGITLTAAKYTIYYSSTYDLEHYLQSRDRMYRKGQTQKTTEYHLLMRNSIDQQIISRIDKKEEINWALLAQELGKKNKMKSVISLKGNVDGKVRK